MVYEYVGSGMRHVSHPHKDALARAKSRAGITGFHRIQRAGEDGWGRTPEKMVERVPVSRIFEIEFFALGLKEDERAKVSGDYDKYCKGMENSVKVWLSGKGLRNASKADEKELFSFMADVFRKDFAAAYDDRTLLAVAVAGNRFNCYASSVLMADVLTRLGKDVGVLITPNHVLLAGEKYAFETTTDGENAAIPKDRLSEDEFYAVRKECGVAQLVGIAHVWGSLELLRRGHLEDALSAGLRAVPLGLRFEGWSGAGDALFEMGRYRDASEAYDKALAERPEDAATWNNKGLALSSLRMAEGAMLAFDKAIGIDPRFAQAWENKARVLESVGRLREAEGCRSESAMVQARNARP